MTFAHSSKFVTLLTSRPDSKILSGVDRWKKIGQFEKDAAESRAAEGQHPLQMHEQRQNDSDTTST